MAIANESTRIQITLNASKEKEGVILDYLSSSFNTTQEVKRILYEYIMNKSDVKVVKNPKNNSKKVTKNKSNTKKVKENMSDEKLLTCSNSTSKKVEVNQSNSKQFIDNNSDDFTLDLSNFDDKVVEVSKSDNNSDLIKKNELDELSKFL